MNHHLAQANIAKMRESSAGLSMSGLVTRIDEMNALAERRAGFIWRLKGTEATPETLKVFEKYFVPFEPERLFYNMSVWRSIEDLRNYTYQTAHVQMLRNKQQWIEHFELPHLVMWWIAEGTTPTISESAKRLDYLRMNGPTPYAFTFKNTFPPPAA